MLVVHEGCVAALGGYPLFCLVTVLVYLLSSRRRTRASGSVFEPEPWCCVLGLLLLGEVLLLGRPFWLVEVALISSSVKSYVSFGVLN